MIEFPDLLNRQATNRTSKRLKRIVKLAAILSLLSSFAELFFTIALTVVGERESGEVHVYFFIGFIVFCSLSQILSAFCCRFSKIYDTNSQAKFCFKIKSGLSLTILLLLPLIFLFFTLYWQYCIRIAYEFFAALEYVTIFVIYASHIVSFIDLRRFECHIVKCKT